MLGQVALAVVATAVAMLCAATMICRSYEKRWSRSARLRRRAAVDRAGRPSVAELVEKCERAEKVRTTTADWVPPAVGRGGR